MDAYFSFIFILMILNFDDAALVDEVYDKQAKLRFYHSSMENFTELSLEDAQNIFATSWYNVSRGTVIFTHGFTGTPKGPAVTAVVSAYLSQGSSNVALLDWEHLAANSSNTLAASYFNSALPNAKKLGVQLAETLFNLSLSGLDLNSTHLVGHSLGAHVIGIAGNVLARRTPVLRLLPCRFGFEGIPVEGRLNPNSAQFVTVIHSDPSKYGDRRQLGTVDFWPNYRPIGPFKQPGCERNPTPTFSSKDLCSHNRCWELLVEALERPGTVVGSLAKDYRTWMRYKKEERNLSVLDLTEYGINVVPGNYYFVTNSYRPFGRGSDGL